MADEVVAELTARLERLSMACDKLDVAYECVRDVSLEDRMNMPELVWPFGFVRKLAQCRRAAHKARVKVKKQRVRAVENHKARVEVERVQFRRARDMNAKYKQIQGAIADLERERECVLNNMRAYDVEVARD